ncbi:MAG TPA: hypothetical protein P5217_03125 [Methanoregulaceae archaeon]|nr:hypothetical protein [Methanoregulaceae archaeon]HPD75005.1 hypothetical protein [Methanoregulaceae archaeon]HRY75252.1 hypothetical protein [Methanoregulaceae archaeon]
MQKIEKTKKLENGVRVFWNEENRLAQDFYSYEELIDMKINAFDLLKNPGIYRVDRAVHRIESSV